MSVESKSESEAHKPLAQRLCVQRPLRNIIKADKLPGKSYKYQWGTNAYSEFHSAIVARSLACVWFNFTPVLSSLTLPRGLFLKETSPPSHPSQLSPLVRYQRVVGFVQFSTLNGRKPLRLNVSCVRLCLVFIPTISIVVLSKSALSWIYAITLLSAFWGVWPADSISLFT